MSPSGDGGAPTPTANTSRHNEFIAGTPIAPLGGMNARLALPVLGLAGALWLTPDAAVAQREAGTKPDRGKVDGVEREARRAGREDDGDEWECEDCGGGFFLFRMIGSALQAFFVPSKVPGQGYQRYPYAERDAAEPFVLDSAATGRRFGTFTGMYFNDQDVGGTLQAAQFALEGANGALVSAVEYTLYREPTQTDTDWLHLARVGLGVAPRLGRLGFVRLLAAGRLIVLDNGGAALGPELELGITTFPVRPVGVSANARGALVNWSGGGRSAFTDLTVTGSCFLGRAELMAGWRYTKVGSAEAFNGPTAGVRLWF